MHCRFLPLERYENVEKCLSSSSHCLLSLFNAEAHIYGYQGISQPTGTLCHQIEGGIIRRGLVFLQRMYNLGLLIVWRRGSMFNKRYGDPNI